MDITLESPEEAFMKGRQIRDKAEAWVKCAGLCGP